MKILALDGNSIINRAFYGIRPLTTKDGRFTNGIYGFINILMKLTELEKPDGVVAAFDLRSPTFRHKMYPEYKAGRKGMPDELAEQLPVLKELLKLMGCHCLELEGFEADDILGTLAAASKNGGNCVISTGDRDSLQLVSERVKVLLAATKMGRPEVITYDEAAIMEKYGVTPAQMIEIKALMGDSSDNIPGVAGIGEKTASDLIQRFHDIDYIYENIDTIDVKEGVRNKLKSGRESAFLSRQLGTINCDVPISKNLADYAGLPCDKSGLAQMFVSLEFYKFIEKFGLSTVPVTEIAPEKSEEWMVTDDFSKVIAAAEKSGIVDIFPAEDGFALYVGAAHTAAKVQVDNFGVMGDLKRLFEDKKIAKRLPSSKEFHRWCSERGIVPANVAFDTEISGYLLDPSGSAYDTERLASEYGVAASGEEEFLKLFLHSGLCAKLKIQLENKGLMPLFEKVELPLAGVLASMELAGFLVDSAGITEYGNLLGKRLDELEGEIYGLVGYEFNLNSPKQLSEALFVKLGLPAKKKTKSGYSTGAEVLEELRNTHPAVELLLEYRQLSKLKSTYCDGLPEKADKNGRIHSTLSQTETRTGRISSAEPNLQNIPVRQKEGRVLRKFFKAEEGYTLCDADYSQIELRVLAHMSEDKAMIKAFIDGDDIHRITASQVFGLPPEMVTPSLRSRAKAVNFGIVYGIGAFSLSKDIGVTRREAEEYINGYFETYPGVKRFMDEAVKNAAQSGYALSMYGRRRDLPELASSNANLRSFGARVAMNMPIQGTAADIIKIAMIRVYNRLRDEKLDARLIMQVHDELIVEAREDIAEKVNAILEEEMSSAVELAVPLLVEAHSGKTWFDAKG